jgi:hypothetical protein
MNETRKLVEENIGDECQSSKVPNKAQFATTQKVNEAINNKIDSSFDIKPNLLNVYFCP